MENGVFSFPVEMFNRNMVGMDGFALQSSNSIIQSDSCNLNDQPPGYGAYTIRSVLQGQPINDIHTGTQVTQQADDVVPEVPAQLITSLERSSMRGVSVGNSNPLSVGAFQEQFLGENTAAATTHFPARNNFPENLSSFPISGSSAYPFELPCPYMSNDALKSVGLSNVSYEDVDVIGRADGKGILDQVNAALELTGKTPIRSEIQPYSSTIDPEAATWMSTVHENLSADNPQNSCRFSNELSLCLYTSRPSVVNGRSLPDQCTELSCSGITRLSLDQGSSASKKPSLSCNSHKAAGHFSQAICGSKYLQVMQEILTDFAIFSTRNIDQTFNQSTTSLNAPFSSFDPPEGGTRLTGFDGSPCMDAGFKVPLDPMQQKRALETKKGQLLGLLQAVDERFSRCLDEIHTVVSAFHAATELDPQVHTRCVLQSISFFYKNLRAKISNQILAMEEPNETHRSPRTLSFEEQLKIKDQLWKPQRGLPETSVSVLRAWMFQNFLHPYPKDAEKHLLAIKSGLTRSQVSNWFINARVRLWKPLIEEMCADMNRRKARQIGS